VVTLKKNNCNSFKYIWVNNLACSVKMTGRWSSYTKKDEDQDIFGLFMSNEFHT